MSVLRATSTGARLSIAVSSIALLVLAVISGALLVFSYRTETAQIRQDSLEIRDHDVPLLAQAIWDFDDAEIEAHIERISVIAHVAHVRLESPDKDVERGSSSAADGWNREFPLAAPDGSPMGVLRLGFSTRSVWLATLQQFGAIAGFATVVLLSMSFVISWVFKRMVGRHLISLADYARSLTVDTLDRRFSFGKGHDGRNDELSRLLGGLDAMRSNLQSQIRGRENAESQLSDAVARYRQIFDSTGDAIFIHDAETGRILDVNRAMLEMYRCTREEAIKSSPADFSAKGEADLQSEAKRRIDLAGAGQPQLFEWRARRMDGSEFWVEVFLNRMEARSGAQILAAVRDVTARKEAEERLAHGSRLDTIGKLAGGIAHDFNNMLTGILGSAELIDMDTQDDEVKLNAKVIRDTARRAAELTSKLLTFARLSPIVMQKNDLKGIVRDAVLILERSIDKAIVVETDLDEAELCVRCDRVQIENAILNLCLNARDAMPEGGRIEISACAVPLGPGAAAAYAAELAPGEYIELAVQDDGVGMPDDIVRNAFDPYFTTKKSGRGTGLGLASVYGTATGHGGAASIESREGEGTTVRMLLPVAHPTDDVQDGVQAAAAAGTGCILLVDDEPVVRETSRQNLEIAGYRVYTAEDGKEGVAIFERHRGEIDVVVLDMVMPNMSGPETFASLRSLDPAVRVVISSGYSEQGAAENLLGQPHTVFLQKPYGSSDLVSAIKNVLQG